MMTIPVLDLKRQYQALKPEIDAAVERVLNSTRFIMGPEVRALEEEIAAYAGVRHAVGVASGTDALLLSLRALGIGPGHGVVVPGFTFFATAGAVCNTGATPIFADIEPGTCNLDTASLRRILEGGGPGGGRNPEIKAVIPVHLYGQSADMDEIMRLAEAHGLHVVEDAAQAIGAEYRGRKVGTIGHLGAFSFFPSKNLGAYGDGGMVVTDDDELAEKVRRLRVHGSKPKYYHGVIGTNSRLDALQAAILRVKLPHLDAWIESRQAAAARYDRLLAGVEGLTCPPRRKDRKHVFHQYTVRVGGGKRDQLQAYLKERGVSTLVYYPLPLHRQECFAHLGYGGGDLPVSEEASKNVLSLPMFPELTAEEQERVAGAVKDFPW